MGPTCAPGGQLSNAEVSSKSGQWRPDWWQKCVLKQSQESIIARANYSNRRVEEQEIEEFMNTSEKLKETMTRAQKNEIQRHRQLSRECKVSGRHFFEIQ